MKLSRLWKTVPLSLGAALLLTGCVSSIVAKKIVQAPNQQGAEKQFPKEIRGLLKVVPEFYAQTWRTVVGPPDAELSVAIIEPADYGFNFEIKETFYPDGSPATFSANCNWTKSAAKIETKITGPLAETKSGVGAIAPKATLILLHGYATPKEAMLTWGLLFAQKGYRIVLVDLRGHGKSSGPFIGFGAWEVADLMKVTDELQRRGLLAGKLGVFGSSYGAAVGIQWAARDPRVATVVALAPFSDMPKAFPEFARGVNPKVASKLTPKTWDAIMDKAAKKAGFAWRDISVLEATKRLRVPVLFYHGKADTWILPAQSEALAQVAPTGSRREVTPQDDHLRLMMRLDLIGAPALAWLDEKLAGAKGALAPVSLESVK